MNTEPLISVICPVYNVEKTLPRMLDSVQNQSYKNLEFIIVDDKSTDSTAEIIKQRIKSDSRIKLICNTENMGPGPAKNRAISTVTGDFITFIDGDDWIEGDTFLLMVGEQRKTDADVVVMGYSQDYLDEAGGVIHSVTILPPIIPKGESYAGIFSLLDISKVFSYCCMKMFRTKIVIDNHICFPSIMYSEDFFFNIKVLPYIKKTAVVRKALYHYIKPQMNTLSDKESMNDFFELYQKRYLASKEYCITQNEFVGEIRSRICEIHIKHLSMYLLFNCSPKKKLGHKQRIELAQRILDDENTIEAVEYCRTSSIDIKIIRSFYTHKKPQMLVLLGRLLWCVRSR